MQFALVVHILAMVGAYFLLMPISVMFGLARSRYHLALQLLTACLAGVGYFFSFLVRTDVGYNSHKGLGFFMLVTLLGQLACGFYKLVFLSRAAIDHGIDTDISADAEPVVGLLGGLRNNPPKGIVNRCRHLLHRVLLAEGTSDPQLPRRMHVVVFIHKWLDIWTLVWAYMEVLLGTLSTLGFCYEPETGRCAAHFIKGSLLVGYGVIQVVLLRLGTAWLARRGRPIEYFESLFFLLFGTVTILHEHVPGSEWSHRDLQHTSIGVIFLLGGLGSFLISRSGFIRTRSPLSALVFLFVGISMGFHHQHTHMATAVHGLFGTAFALTALFRLIEIMLLSNDPHATLLTLHPLQIVTAFFAILSGYLLMGSTNEQTNFLMEHHLDVGSYGMMHVAFAFTTLTMAVGMILLYETVRGKNDTNGGKTSHGPESGDYPLSPMSYNTTASSGATYHPLDQHGSDRASSENTVSFEASHHDK
ncbi:hypothetical protein H4R33_003542 [Dimargaris cristalligena]|nr:hypothetical protein H4R33_003542 [Dimargaris cristalligena]